MPLAISTLIRYRKELAVISYGVAVENMLGRHGLFNSAESGKKILENVKSENVGLRFDVGHANLLGGINSFLRVFSNETIHIHIHDNDEKEDRHLPADNGNIEWKSLLNWLEKVRYRRWVVFENYELSDVKQGMQFLTSNNVMTHQ